MHVIAFVHNGFTEARISAPQDVAVNGKFLLVSVVHSLKHGEQAETDTDRVYVIVAHA
jgi:hypothetical protein